MNNPVTTLDEPYSGAGAVALSWPETGQVLESAELFWISTVRPDGRPHVTPVVAVWTGGVVCFTTGAEEQKFANLCANPHVVLTTGCNTWDRGIDVMVEGDAVQVTDDAALRPLAAAFTTKWEGQWQFVVRDGHFYHGDSGDSAAEVFTVTPVKVWAHAKGDPFAATRHLFRPGA
jgi:pyridoxamine 5'-phosphate oxidase-like protein